MNTQSRAAIVTGSSRGIGAAVVKRLAEDGFAVAINYSGDAAPANKLASTIKEAGGKALAIKADVSDPAEVKNLFDAVATEFGRIDVLVNNAGIMKLAKLVDTDDQLFNQSIAINLKGAFNCMREAAARLNAGGSIVNFSSSVVGLYQPSYAVYVATKGAIEAMTHVLSKELGEKKITVNAIAPGPTATDLFLKDKSDEEIKPIVGRTPLGRLGEPDDIARTVSFLVGPEGGWINGQVLRVNGGII
ncbi:3-oxoacyl-[acyl-carrier protein] reductase [Caballeronia sordidicola]|uniref:3-oxoacyl-[acyl-carrier protein] reductase n=1 Tax=Caballeronia sordidicola TaxID=196367 RepID=A0A242M6C6_CABSO|nr:SDR family oxidoreductase [Caballeronia sordidicola]OTP66581.1 3-oxoacyl-[acyl-carrier protein] reductase [Caballeronia sordidicola]